MKVKLIFKNSFIAPVENAHMDHSYRTVDVEVPDYLYFDGFTVIGGEFEQPKRDCKECLFFRKDSGCSNSKRCDDNHSRWRQRERPGNQTKTNQ
jgi:hypothetical protein